MERETEPMVDASTKCNPPNRKWADRSKKAGGVQMLAETTGIRDMRATARQSWSQPAVLHDPNPYGVESVPNADKGMIVEPGNLAATSLEYEMIETTDDRRGKRRSLRSSPRAGKPFTWRREAVG